MNTASRDALPPVGEFIALVAMLSSLTALSIDAMLPALGVIGRELGVVHANDPQLVLSALFLGLGCGQILFGPLSDATGRKPPMFVGLGVFALGSLLAMLASDFHHMLLGRFLQGLGASAPRVLSMALVRDCFSGREMARIVSFTMSVFILVPMLAPSLGQGILLLTNWRGIFTLFLVLALIVAVWLWLRMPETLAAENRKPFRLQAFVQSAREVLTNTTAMRYTLTAGLIFGAFVGYLASVQQVLQIQYGLGERFPLVFAVLALGLGTASFLNGRLVMRYGMHLLARRGLLVFTLLSGLFWVVAWRTHGQPPLEILLTYLLLAFFAVGMLFGNLNALAMEPLGHVAGVGSAIVGSGSTLLSVPLGTYIGQSYDGTVLPIITGFFVLGTLAMALVFSQRPHN